MTTAIQTRTLGALVADKILTWPDVPILTVVHTRAAGEDEIAKRGYADMDRHARSLTVGLQVLALRTAGTGSTTASAAACDATATS